MPGYKDDHRRVINSTPYPSGIEVARLHWPPLHLTEKDIAFYLPVDICKNMKLDPMTQVQRLAIPVWALRSQENFESAINRNAPLAFKQHDFLYYDKQYGIPYYDQTSRLVPIPRQHLRFFLHAHDSNSEQCLRVLKLEDFLRHGSHEVREEESDGIFHLHVYLADGVDIDAVNFRRPSVKPVLLLPGQIDAMASDDQNFARLDNPGRSGSATIDQTAASNSNATSLPPAAATTSVDNQSQNSTSPPNRTEQEPSSTQPTRAATALESAPDSPPWIPDADRPSSPLPPVPAAATLDVSVPPGIAQAHEDQDTVMTDADELPEEESDEADDMPEDKAKFIRLGTLQIDEYGEEVPTAQKLKKDGKIIKEIVVVAYIAKYRTSIAFSEINSWDINGTAVADYDNRKLIEAGTLKDRVYKPDPLFAKAYKHGTLEQMAKNAAQRIAKGDPYPSERSAPYWAPDKDVAFTSTANPMRGKDGDKVRCVVAVIKDRERHKGPGPTEWYNYLLGDLDLDDDFRAVHDWATGEVEIDGDITLKGALEEARGSAWYTELWVLPQVSERDVAQKVMFSWTAQPGLRARDWLDAKVWKKHRRGGCLYLELRIFDRSA